MSYSKSAVQTVDDRIAEKTVSPIGIKFNSTGKSRQKTALTMEGFEGYSKISTPADKPTETDKIKIGHACGPISGSIVERINPSILNPEAQYDESIVSNWMPHMSLAVADGDTGHALTAAQIDVKKTDNNNWIPNYFMNPMQDLDYIVLEALTRFTFIGPLMDSLTKFIIGTGFKPELELINPSNDKDKNRKEIAEGEEIITTLTEIDNQLNVNDTDYIDTSFTEKIAALISATNIYNRAGLVFGYDTPIEVNGTKYKQIPSSLKFAHPRDLGIIDVEPSTWRLRKVQWRNAYYMIPSKDMIYLWNPLISAKTRSSWLYGDSTLMPMIDAARVIRKNIGVNFPAMAEATWAGMYILTVKPQAQNIDEKKKEYAQIAGQMVRGGPNILLEDPANVKSDTIDFQPKVNEFINMNEALIKYCVACTGLPHSMFYDESAANRATMLGKIQLATSTVINPMRAWIGREISNQWYQRWFRLIYKDSKPELYKKYKIKMSFSDLNIAEWYDKIAAVNELDSRKQLTDDAYGDLASLDNYKDDVEPGAPVQPGGSGKTVVNFSRQLSLDAKSNPLNALDKLRKAAYEKILAST